MTVQNPAVFLQAESHPAEDVRRYFAGVSANAEGVLHVAGSATSSLEVTEKSGTPDMSVDVATGSCLILGTEGTYQGTYFCENRGTTNLVVSASDATNARWDLVVAKVEDSDYSGATDAWSLAVVTGTPAASPADPAVPDNSITLARIVVAALATDVDNADITDLRPWARLHGETADVTPSDFTPSAVSTEETVTGSTITQVDPGRPVYVEAHGSGTAETTATDGRLKCDIKVQVSTDGGSTWTGNDASADVDHTYIRRNPLSARVAVGPVLPTGDVQARIRYNQVSNGGSGVTTQLQDVSLTCSWHPA